MGDSTFIGRDSRISRILWMVVVLDLISWAVSIGAVVIIHQKYAVYETELRAYFAAGGSKSRCTNVPNTCLPYEPSPSKSLVLLTTLLPLIFDTVFLPTALFLALRDHLHPVFLLCGALFAFIIWASCGIFNAMYSLWSSWESQERDDFDHVWGAVAGLQVLNGFVWLCIMIAACCAVHKNNKGKRVEQGRDIVASALP